MIQQDIQGPVIVKLQRALGGIDNAGIGSTAFGEQFLLKLDPAVALAEFVGASVCHAIGIPHCQPCQVQYKGRIVFGSRLERGVQSVGSQTDLMSVLGKCSNPDVFSAQLAVDLALGNVDRHWNNWIYQQVSPTETMIRAVDFSRAWPTGHPPTSCEGMRGHNTHQAWATWPALGINFDGAIAQDVCERMGKLNGNWAHNVVENLPLEWKIHPDVPMLCGWWEAQWQQHVDGVKQFVANGAWK